MESMGIPRVRDSFLRGIPDEGTMLIRYTCKDMGLKCNFVVKGETIEEVTQKALDHIRVMHSSEFNTIFTPEQITAMRQALARSTRVVPD